MKKQIVLSLISLLALSACGKESSSLASSQGQSEEQITTSQGQSGGVSTPSFEPIPGGGAGGDTPISSSSGGGEVIRQGSWDNVLAYDYSNVTVATIDTDLADVNYTYYLGGGKYVDYYTYGDTAFHEFYADYKGENYKYWDYTSDGGKKGWCNLNLEYNIKLDLASQTFFIPNLLNNIKASDVEYYPSIGTYYLKESALEKFKQKVLYFAWEGHPAVPELVYFTTSLDENNHEYLNRMYCFDDKDALDQGTYVVCEFSEYGTTKSYWEFPEEPNESNIYDWWTLTGREEPVYIYPEEINLKVEDSVESDDEYDIIITEGDKIYLTYDVGPEGVNIGTKGMWYIYPDDSSFRDGNGNYKESFENQPVTLTYTNTSRRLLLTAWHAGEEEVYVSYVKDTTDTNPVVSNKLKVKVNPRKGVDPTGALYNLEIDDAYDEYYDYVWGKESGYYQTVVEAINNQNSYDLAPYYSISGFNVSTLAGRYTDAFSSDETTLSMSPFSARTSDGLTAYVDFDFGEQKVTSLQFAYSLHVSGHIANFDSNCKEVLIQTSEDGNTWTTIDSAKDEFSARFNEDNVSSGMSKKLYEQEFAPTSHIRILSSASSFGKNFTIVMNNFILKTTEAIVPEVEYVSPTGVSILEKGEEITVRKNNEVTLTGVVAPANATNRRIQWTSLDHSVATVKPNKDGTVTVTGLKEGSTTIKVASVVNPTLTDEVTITVLSDATLPEGLEGSYKNNEGDYSLYATFDNKNCKVDITYIPKNKAPIIDTLYLSNEKGGLYTFKSNDSEVAIYVEKDATLTGGYYLRLQSTSNIKGSALSAVELVKMED